MSFLFSINVFSLFIMTNLYVIILQRDGYKSTGCYNLQCHGYVPEPNIHTVPGIAIDAVSTPDGVKRTIIFKVFKVVKKIVSPLILMMQHISMRRTIRYCVSF